jgi:hypothetical protein
MRNSLNDGRLTALEEQACTEAGCVFAAYLKQFPVSREAVERIERNMTKLALAANHAASKPAKNVIQADDGASWRKAVDLMDNIFLCHRQTTGGTEYAVVEHFPAHRTNEIWNQGWNAIQVLRVFAQEQRRALEFGMQDATAQAKEFLAEKYFGQEMSHLTDSFMRRFSHAAAPPHAHT